MRILLFGRHGQVGWELQRSLAPLGALVALDRHSTEHCGDLANLSGIAATIADVRPDVVVNAAAYTAVDRAEKESAAANRINADAPGVMAEATRRLGAWLVHYSTDYVFDGSGDRPWVEHDVTAPVSVYGLSKLLGEHAVRQATEHHLMFRTSWVYAARGGNFLHTMLGLAQEREKLSVVADQVGAPTGAELIADVTAHALRATVRGHALGGTYHLAAAGETTWHGYASHIIETARRSANGMRIHCNTIAPVPSSAWPTTARRPANSRLNTDLLRQEFGFLLPPWQLGVDRVLAECGWGAGTSKAS